MTTKPKTEHSPLPWDGPFICSVRGTEEKYAVSRGDFMTGRTVFSDATKEDAEFIVRACNNHDRLVGALKESLEAMERMDALLLKLTNSPKDCEKGEIERARQALSSAKG